MKKRQGFVSNSSSSSFIVEMDAIEKLENIEFNEQEAHKYSIKETIYSKNSFYEGISYYEKKGDEIPDYYVEESLPNGNFNWSKSYEKHYQYYLANFKTLKNIRNDAKIKNIYEIAEEYRRNEERLEWKINKGCKLRFDDYFDRYEIGKLGNIGKKLSKRLYYIIKPILDNPKKRLKFYELVTERDISVGLIHEYESFSRRDRIVTRQFQRKNDLRICENYKKLAKLNSKQFYNEFIIKEVNLYTNGDWNGFLTYDRIFKISELKDYFNILDCEMVKAGHKIVDDFIKKNKDTNLYEVEYQDGGGCGIYAPLLEYGMYFDQVKHQKISRH